MVLSNNPGEEADKADEHDVLLLTIENLLPDYVNTWDVIDNAEIARKFGCVAEAERVKCLANFLAN